MLPFVLAYFPIFIDICLNILPMIVIFDMWEFIVPILLSRPSLKGEFHSVIFKSVMSSKSF
jgi:hypothetical protein